MRLNGAPFQSFNPNLTLNAEFVHQRNANRDREVRANAWYVEPGYKFASLPWSPMAFYRYAQFSGDKDPGDRTDRSYDPLFVTGGVRGAGPGTWFLGEIYSQYLGVLSNINVHQVHVRASPTETLNLGVLLFRFAFDDNR